MNLNKVMLIGNLTRDPEKKVTPNGTTIVTFSVATTRKWKDKKDGTSKEETEFTNITSWGKLAEIVGQYLTKGAKVYAEGHLKTTEWQDKAGNKRRTTGVVLENMIMLGSKPAGQSAPAPADDTAQPAPPTEDEINIADIPF